jgi:Mrp family chromosome partitioning ATPase/capsular polysaccharide biosynthesis protein
MDRATMTDTTDAGAIFAPLWRRKWLILIVGILVAVASYAYYKQKTPTYQASTQVFEATRNEEPTPGEKASARSAAATVTEEVQIINSIVVEAVHRTLRSEGQTALARSVKVHAKGAEKSQFITITSEAHTAKGAVQAANLTATTYIQRQRALRRRSIERALAISRRQLSRVEAASNSKAALKTGANGKTVTPSGPSNSSIIEEANLSTKINQLEASLSSPGPQQIRPARVESALLVNPKPRKNAIFGFVLGIALASIAAYVFSRFDRRLRTLEGIEAVFGSQILTALPEVARPVVHRSGQPEPSRVLLEPIRRLHGALQFAGEGTAPRRVIVFVSPDAGDGKSTLVADLAMVQRDAGLRVAVVEANFRRPVQARLLDLDGSHGLADVLSGRLAVEEAMERVLPANAPVGPDELEPAGGGTTATASRAGSLFLLAGGVSVPNPPALLASDATADLVGAKLSDFDHVLIDAPSPLEVSDVLPVLKLADAIVIVARVAHTREGAAERLVQLLAQAASAPVFGVVANCVPRSGIERYGFSSSPGKLRPRRLLRR